MQVSIGPFDAETKTVPVTFGSGKEAHKRAVNACLTEGGDYDEEATALRVEEVARGVEHKLAVGAIGKAPPAPLPPAEKPPVPEKPTPLPKGTK